MSDFKILFSERAMNDVKSLYDFIDFTCKSPRTAKNYVFGLRDEIKKLSYSANAYVIQDDANYKKYGTNIRRLNFKKMTVLFTLENNEVIILSIIPSGLIK